MLESTPARKSGLLVRRHASRSPRHHRMSSSSRNHQWTSSTATAPADLRGAAAVLPSALGMVLSCYLRGRAPRSVRSCGCHTRAESPVSSTATGPADLRGAAAVPPSALDMVLGCCLGGRAPRSERSRGRSGAEESSVRGCHGPSQRDVTRGTMAFSSVAAPLPRPLALPPASVSKVVATSNYHPPGTSPVLPFVFSRMRESRKDHSICSVGRQTWRPTQPCWLPAWR